MSSGAHMVGVYRTLLRTAKVFDTQAGWKALVFLPHLHGIQGAAGGTEVAQAVDAARAEFTHGGPWQPQHGSLGAFIRKAFRRPPPDASVELGLGVALAAQAELLRIATVARGVSGAAQFQLPTSLPELMGELSTTLSIDNGTLLLEHPAAPAPGGAALVVYDQDQHVQEADGDEDFVVRGVVVNRPFPFQVKEAFPSLDLGPLGDLPLWWGGSADEALYVLHRCSGITNAVELNKGALWIGGNQEELVERLSSGDAMPEDFKVLMGCTHFSGGTTEEVGAQLQAFIPATGTGVASAALLPPVPLQGEYEEAITAAGAELEEGEGYEHDKFWHQNATWASCLTMMGGDFASMGAQHPVLGHILGEVLASPDDYAVAGGGEGAPGASVH